MAPPSKLRVRGIDHASRGRVTMYPSLDRHGPPATLAITSGLRKGFNEDAGGWDRLSGRAFYAVADAHYGAKAAPLAVDCCLSHLSAQLIRKDHFEADRFRKLFCEVLAQVEEIIARDPQAAQSETTLLAVAVGHGRVFYGSYGDSRLYVAGSGGPRQVNRTESVFLAGSEEPDIPALATQMVCGELRALATGGNAARLLLSTDGIPECRGRGLPDWDAESICAILAEAADVSSAAANLVAAALQRGGDDNICAIVAEPASVSPRRTPSEGRAGGGASPRSGRSRGRAG